MLAHYGVDTTAPGCSLRRVETLIERLPPGAWPDQDNAASWTYEAHLLATMIDTLTMQTFELLRALGGKPKQPKPFYRPGGKTRPAPRSAPERPEPVKTSGWIEFAKALVGAPGVKVIEGG